MKRQSVKQTHSSNDSDDGEGDQFSFAEEHMEDEKKIKCRNLPTLTHLKLCKFIFV